MNLSMRLRLGLLVLGIGALALFLGWAANRSRRETGTLHEQFGNAQTVSFGIADHLQATILKLNNLLVAYALRGDSSVLAKFEKESNELNTWMDSVTNQLKSTELAALRRIDTNYDVYLITANSALATVQQATNSPNPPGTVPPRDRILQSIEAVTEAAQSMHDLGTDLEKAHRTVWDQSLEASRASISRLERYVLVSLLLLLGLGLWLAATVYHELIAPLRLKLVESQAVIERQEKLASLGLLAAGVAHEIRNPLTAIKARLFTQQKRLTPGSPEHADAAVIDHEINRLERIVRDFLLFARPSDPQFVITSADEPLRHVQALLAAQLDKAGIRLVVEDPPPARIRIDPQQFSQLFINLVQNSAEAIGQNGTVTLRARLDTRRLAGHPTSVVILEVEDTGKGIPPEVQKRLFDPFFSTKDAGTGLGLAIAARIVEKHGGTLQYQTQVNRGTTFGVVLPRVTEHESTRESSADRG